jgi:hypothetical protein
MRAVLDAIFYIIETGCQWRMLRGERWPGESGQEDKWIFCLRAARIAADQERA